MFDAYWEAALAGRGLRGDFGRRHRNADRARRRESLETVELVKVHRQVDVLEKERER